MNPFLSNEDGVRYGRLVVIHEVPKTSTNRLVLCRCDCGNEKIVLLKNLKNGATKSCGCLHRAIMQKHGKSHAPIYDTYRSMIKRCYNPNHKSYKSYGGRGIVVCEKWRGGFLPFYQWAVDNGYKEGLTLDRKDNNGGYSPENCRWVDLITQANNRRDNVWYDFNGVKMTLAQICREFGIADKRRLVKQRMVKYNWNLMDAIKMYL